MKKLASSDRMDLDESKINAVNVDESAIELQQSWFSCSREIFCLNTYPNGITFSVHKNPVTTVNFSGKSSSSAGSTSGDSNFARRAGAHSLTSGDSLVSGSQFLTSQHSSSEHSNSQSTRSKTRSRSEPSAFEQKLSENAARSKSPRGSRNDLNEEIASRFGRNAARSEDAQGTIPLFASGLARSNQSEKKDCDHRSREHSTDLPIRPDAALGDITAEISENKPKFLPNQFDLRLRDTRDYQLPVGRYFLYKENYASALEYHLSQLHKSSALASSVFYFGVATDPFLYSERKGHVTSQCVELLEQFQPGFLVLQTRSSKILSMLPTLKAMKDRVVVSISIESINDRLLEHYAPHQPKLTERLFTADRLREEGIKVQLRASPILPYGDFYRDAWRFAELLTKHADYVSFGGLSSGSASEEQQLRDLPVARKLASEQQFRMLRPFAYRCVYYAVQSLAPEKLHIPAPTLLEPSQLSLFGNESNATGDHKRRALPVSA